MSCSSSRIRLQKHVIGSCSLRGLRWLKNWAGFNVGHCEKSAETAVDAATQWGAGGDVAALEVGVNAAWRLLSPPPRYSGALRSSGANAPSQYITAGMTQSESLMRVFETHWCISTYSVLMFASSALRDLYETMEKTSSSLPPIILLQFLHMAFPQFAEKGDQGQYLQQVTNSL